MMLICHHIDELADPAKVKLLILKWIIQHRCSCFSTLGQLGSFSKLKNDPGFEPSSKTTKKQFFLNVQQK